MAAQDVYTLGPFEAFYLHLRGLEYAESTIRQYQIALTVAQRMLDGRGLHEATGAELRRLLTMTSWAANTQSGTKINTIAKLVHYREWAARQGLGDLAVVAELRELQKMIRPQRNKLPTFLELGEVDELERAMWARSREPARDVAVLWTLAGAGGRITETLRLQMNDVNLREWMVWFRHDTKGGKARSVPMLGRLRERLQSWLEVRVSPTTLLFPSNRHGPLDVDGWARLLHRTALTVERPTGQPSLQRAVCKTHGEGVCRVGECSRARWRVHPHTLRHTFAVEALRSGACSLVELRDILGHSSVATTNIYANVVHDEAAATRFRRRFGKGQQ